MKVFFVITLFIAFLANAASPDRQFSVALFLNPTVKRDSKWPEKLTFEDANLSTKQLRTEIVGTWQMSGMCNGRPISLERAIVLEEEGYYLGVNQPGITMQYSSDGIFRRMLTQSRTGYLQGKMASTEIIDQTTYHLVELDGGKTELRSPTFAPGELKMYRTVETGELVMIITDIYNCEGNTKMDLVLTKIPQS